MNVPIEMKLPFSKAMNRQLDVRSTSGVDRRDRMRSSESDFFTRQKPIKFLDFLRAVMMRKWRIFFIILLVAILASFAAKLITPLHRSTATVLIESHKQKIVSIDEVYSGVSNGREHLQTQAEILKSRDIALRVVRKLELARHPDFDPRQEKPQVWDRWLSELAPQISAYFTKSPRLDDASAEAKVLRRFAAQLTVEPIRLSNLIRVSFETRDPELAADTANAVVEAYMQADLDNRKRMTQSAGQWINERLAELRKRLDTSENSLQTYREREGILDSKSTVLSGTSRQFDELTLKLIEARVRRSEAEEAYNQVNGLEASDLESAPAVVKNPSVQRAKEAEAEAEKKLAELSQRYGPDHPRHAAATSDLNSARSNTKRQTQTIVASVQKEYNAARATEKTIETALGQSKGAIQGMNRKEIQLGVLEREVAANSQLYLTFLSRFKETNATSESLQANARLIDPAAPSVASIRPTQAAIVSGAVGLTLLACLLGTLIVMRLDDTLQTCDEVESKLGQPFLAALPILYGDAKLNAARVIIEDPLHPFAESIRTASTGIVTSELESPNKVVAITSSLPDEGKSTFAISLALSQAYTKRVVIIEADIRRPSLAKSLRLPSDYKGVSDLVSGNATLAECLLKVDGTNLHVIASGRLTSNPQQILESRRFKALLSVLRDKYDTVIIDCPPVQLVSDALIIGKQATGMIFVVRSSNTSARLAKANLKRLVSAAIPVFGVVLTHHDFRKASLYYGDYLPYRSDSYMKNLGHVNSAASPRVSSNNGPTTIETQTRETSPFKKPLLTPLLIFKNKFRPADSQASRSLDQILRSA